MLLPVSVLRTSARLFGAVAGCDTIPSRDLLTPHEGSGPQGDENFSTRLLGHCRGGATLTRNLGWYWSADRARIASGLTDLPGQRAGTLSLRCTGSVWRTQFCLCFFSFFTRCF